LAVLALAAAITLPGMPRPSSPPAGLCDSCRHQQVVRTTRGSSFSLCRRWKEDDRYPRYPRLPVLRCRGHEQRAAAGEDAAADPDADGQAT
jgi:hypothetical protein